MGTEGNTASALLVATLKTGETIYLAQTFHYHKPAWTVSNDWLGWPIAINRGGGVVEVYMNECSQLPLFKGLTTKKIRSRYFVR
jgi:hypothetical protein